MRSGRSEVGSWKSVVGYRKWVAAISDLSLGRFRARDYNSRSSMPPRRRYFTPTQWMALILLAGGALATLALLAVLLSGGWAQPPVVAVAAVAARITITPRPPTATPLPTH